jgi:hypothetical protein
MEYWKVTESEGSIVITTFGHDKVGTWPAAVVQFGAHIARRRQEVHVIADVREMTGYETGARRAWQEAFRQHRHLMRAVVFIGARSRGIRMGAAVVAAVAGVPVRFVDGWAEVEKLRF